MITDSQNMDAKLSIAFIMKSLGQVCWPKKSNILGFPPNFWFWGPKEVFDKIPLYLFPMVELVFTKVEPFRDFLAYLVLYYE